MTQTSSINSPSSQEQNQKSVFVMKNWGFLILRDLRLNIVYEGPIAEQGFLSAQETIGPVLEPRTARVPFLKYTRTRLALPLQSFYKTANPQTGSASTTNLEVSTGW
jgi:hypothetical protein